MPTLLPAIDAAFSAIVVGLAGGMAVGATVEETGRVTRLWPGSVVRSMPSELRFDPGAIVETGLAMVEDQRRRHGLVAGWVQHVELRAGQMTSRILRRWDDRPAGLRAAKIKNLDVDTINFAPSSVTGMVSRSGNGPVTVPNPGLFPNTITAQAIYTYYGNGSSNGARCRLQVVRTRGGKVLADVQSGVHAGSTGGSPIGPYTLNAVAIDEDAQDMDVYTVTASQVTTGSGPGSFGINLSAINENVFYTKR